MNKCIITVFAVLLLSIALPLHAEESTSTPDTASTSPATTEPDVETPSPASAASTTLTLPTNLDSEASSTPDVSTQTSITLDIESATSTLFNQTISVSACPVSPTSATSTINGLCALTQAGLANNWSWYGDDAFLDTLGGSTNDYSQNAYWTWFSNLQLGTVALNKHVLSEGEVLLLTIGRLPLRLTATTSPTGTTSITVSQFGFDENYDAVWLPAASSTVHVGDQEIPVDALGQAVLTAQATSTILYATENGFLPSQSMLLAAVQPASDPDPAPETAANSPTRGGGGIVDTPSTPVSFLSGQKEGETFGSAMLDDWAAIALASAHVAFVPKPSTLLSATDFERRAMALEAAGEDPYDAGAIQAIVADFDGTQIGDPALVNDDIFSLLPLLHAGYSTRDSVIQKEIAYILSKQQARGSWENTDLTAAAVQALAPVRSAPGVVNALANARSFLQSQQAADGCFGNSFTTAWVLQAIAALGEDQATWAKNGTTPAQCFRAHEGTDGGFEPQAEKATRIWATAYAIPALEGKPWDSLLHSFTKNESATTAPIADSTPTPIAPTSSATSTADVFQPNASSTPVLRIQMTTSSSSVPLAKTAYALRVAGRAEHPRASVREQTAALSAALPAAPRTQSILGVMWHQILSLLRRLER